MFSLITLIPIDSLSHAQQKQTSMNQKAVYKRALQLHASTDASRNESTTEVHVCVYY